MPVSDQANITPIMLEVARLRPKKILDLGVGWGKYGLLCREMLDIEAGNLDKKSWQTGIIGYEGFEAYRNPIHDYAYDAVYYMDFMKALPFLGYDLVLMIDSLEHISKVEGYKLLDQLLSRNKNVIVSCPTGASYLEQGAVYGNEFERHRAHWTTEDFEVRGGKILYHGVCVVASLKGQRANTWT